MTAITTKTWADEYLTMVDDCEKRESQLTEWESGFIDSIGVRIGNDMPLTIKQIETLESIWERVTKHG